MLYKERGVFNRVQSSTVCNASATNFGRIPIFPPFSVTQTLISVTQEITEQLLKLQANPGNITFPGFFFSPWKRGGTGENPGENHRISSAFVTRLQQKYLYSRVLFMALIRIRTSRWV